MTQEMARRRRGTNGAQHWYCEICERTLPHYIGGDDGDGPTPSHWRTYNGLDVYWRKHLCNPMMHGTETAEIPLSELLRLQAADRRLKTLQPMIAELDKVAN